MSAPLKNILGHILREKDLKREETLLVNQFQVFLWILHQVAGPPNENRVAWGLGQRLDFGVGYGLITFSLDLVSDMFYVVQLRRISYFGQFN